MWDRNIALSCFALLAARSVAAADCTLAASGSDDAPAFLAAVAECDTVIIPSDTTLNVSTRLDMSTLSDTLIDLQGTIAFYPDIPYWSGNAFSFDFQDAITAWLLGGTNVTLSGGGTLDGLGQEWYDEFASNSSLLRPIILTVYQGDGVTIKDITMLNGPMWVNLVYESNNVVYDNITITAASTSDNDAKNTDGWDTYRCDNIVIQNSIINNGDDCVSFKPNSTNILVSNLDCTGSHGISVGSLGQYPEYYDIVENVTAINIRMSNAQNGARIKAWAGPDVGSGIVRNITFQNFIESEVDNPVVIDQCYMTDEDACAEYPSNTYIADIYFKNITGTGTDSVVASIDCSPDGRCLNVNVDDLSLTGPDGDAEYVCENLELSGNAVDLFSECTYTS
ncbi:glycoside hydrolase family 28 protein [Schizophyllum amplum]|uniref:galacturonan 1,4-alpha-galacturonidase n=1 Tax=Schizophyllum amplum TaxID=97359 RepID=A0A550CW23_9AGAR|nr:glycoside hydrolase family 28 protein [Auriculariopsis ampla]